MKKNKMLRIASILLVVTLLSTCVISGTFAKYVTKAEGQDQARVAKWGVLLSVEGKTFADKYETDDEYYDGEFSVVASNEDQVVAPGTDSEQVGQKLVATVNGAPEVAARYTIEAKGMSDVCLPKGTYTDYTELGEDGKYSKDFTLAKDYAPVKWDMKISKGSTSYTMVGILYDNLPSNFLTVAQNYGLSREGCSLTDAITIIQKVAGNDTYKQIVENGLAQIVSGGRNFMLDTDVGPDGKPFVTLSYDFDPNKQMGFTFELSWKWLFEQENVELYDKADTFLGNWAAFKLGDTIEDFVEPTDPKASSEVGATFVATATQID